MGADPERASTEDSRAATAVSGPVSLACFLFASRRSKSPKAKHKACINDLRLAFGDEASRI